MNTFQKVAVISAVVVTLGVSLVVPVTTGGANGGSPLPGGVKATGLNGLQLGVTLNATQLRSGQSLGIQVEVFNTLSNTNNASAPELWPFQVQSQACPNGFYPFGVALFQGRYSNGNASEATPLQIFPDLPCPLFLRYISGYFFQPNSTAASVLPGSSASLPMSSAITVNGTYTGGSQLQNLTPGIYTVAAADEWGVAVFLYFQVR